MARIYISIGSNIDRENRVRAAVRALREQYGDLAVSSVYESEAVGFAGDPFLNLVVGCDTEQTVFEVHARLRAIEEANGRVRGGERFSARTLDLDLLTYDALVLDEQGVQIPRDEITKNAFVLWPLAELAPMTPHPLSGQRYGALWAAYDKSRQPLHPIPFCWD